MSKYQTADGVPHKREELEHLVRECKLESLVSVKHNKQGYFVAPQKQRVVAIADDKITAMPSGICAKVRHWTGTHPKATLAEAIKRFPNANKTTVRIQYNKARA